MDSGNIQLIITGIAFIFSVAGIFFNQFATNKHGSELNKRQEHCERFVIQKISDRIYYITSHLKGETDRMLEFALREFANLVREGKNGVDNSKETDNGDFRFDQFELGPLDLEFKESFVEIQKAFNYMKKIRIATLWIEIFRWLFWGIFSAIIIFGFIAIIKRDLMAYNLSFYILGISLGALILYGLYLNIVNGLISKTERKYGVSD